MQTVSEALAAIWAYYGQIAEAIYRLIRRMAPEADFVAYVLAVLWPFLIVFTILWVVVFTHERLEMRRIRRDTSRRIGQASILRDRCN
jgi:hypothetical protein